MELEVVGRSDAMIRVGKFETEVLCSGLSESGERHWSAENVFPFPTFVCSDAMIRVSVICM